MTGTQTRVIYRIWKTPSLFDRVVAILLDVPAGEPGQCMVYETHHGHTCGRYLSVMRSTVAPNGYYEALVNEYSTELVEIDYILRRVYRNRGKRKA